MDRMPLYRKVGNEVINIAYNLFASGKVNDTQSGFRAFSRKAIEKIRVTDNGFGFSVESLSKARKLGLSICEVPIKAIYHDEFGQNSSKNPIRHGVGVLLCAIRWRVWEIIGR